MAKLITRKSKGAQQPTGKIVLTASGDTPVYYVNYVEISHLTQHDFAMTVSQLPSRATTDVTSGFRETGELRVPATLMLTFPPTMIASLIKALTIQKEKYEKSFGPIPEQEA